MLISVRRLLSRKRLDEVAALRAAVDAIVRRSPSAVFWDATYPHHVLHLARPDCLIAAHPKSVEIEWSFFGRFHEPMDLRPVERFTRELQERAKLPSETRIWAFAGSDPASLDAYLANLGGHSRVLFTCPVDDAERLVDKALPRDFRLICFKTRSAADVYVFGLVPEQAADDDPVVRTATPPSLASWPSGGRHRLGIPMVDCPPIDSQSAVSLPANCLINDGQHRIEEEGGRSRLWTSGMLRVCLGHVPSTFGSLAVRFAPSAHHEDIERALRFQLNGRRVDHQVRMSGDLGAVANVPLSPSGAAELVLGIACRLRTRTDSGRMVSACIEGIDLLP